jgi:succinyl-CoA synthetase beta subunit
MNLHEFQAKQWLARYGVAVPQGVAVRSATELEQLPTELAALPKTVVKAQIHAGARGKAGGVRVVEGGDALRAAVEDLLGSRLATPQTHGRALPVETVLVEETLAVAHEYYLALLVDRARERVAVMASADGGMDIEAVAEKTPERIHTVHVDPAAGLQGYQARQLAFAIGLPATLVGSFSTLVLGLYRFFMESDASLVEINPLVETDDGRLIALDAKVNLDDNAIARHPDLLALRDRAQEDPAESAAAEHELNFIKLDGNIGCMVNGAGLAMATMDLIQLHGGMPANFLDVGGGTTAARVAEAFKLILQDAKVKAILVNIFGGIVRCDLIAEGILQAVQEVGVPVPVVVRLEGTKAEEGRALLDQSGLNLMTASGLTDAAQRAVAAAGVQA